MSYSSQLFEGDLVCLAPLDMEHDPEVFARWSQDGEYLSFANTDMPIPISKVKAKKKLEGFEKEMEENGNSYFFTIRSRSDDRLIGYTRIFWIEWSGGVGRFEIIIGDVTDRRKGYGSEAMKLMMQFAFNELNLYNLGVWVPEYNPVALSFFYKSGFVEEARRRKALELDNRRWDMIHLGLMRDEYLQLNGEVKTILSGEALTKTENNRSLSNSVPDATVRPGISQNGSLRGDLVRLVVEEPDIMGKAFSRWGRNSEYMRLLDSMPVHLYSAKKIQDWIEKDTDKEFTQPFFAIRTLIDDALIGFVGLDGFSWHHGDAWVGIGIGEPAYWGKGYGTDAMRILIDFAFTRLNIERISLSVFGYNDRAKRSYEKAGFIFEGSVRGFLYRDGRRSDLLMMGILREDWQKLKNRG